MVFLACLRNKRINANHFRTRLARTRRPFGAHGSALVAPICDEVAARAVWSANNIFPRARANSNALHWSRRVVVPRVAKLLHARGQIIAGRRLLWWAHRKIRRAGGSACVLWHIGEGIFDIQLVVADEFKILGDAVLLGGTEEGVRVRE